jgi:hypothetical protein
VHGLREPGHIHPVSRHPEIRHQQIHRLLAKDRETGKPALSLIHCVAEFPEQAPEGNSARWIIVDE